MLSKPFSPRHLLATVNEVLDRHGRLTAAVTAQSRRDVGRETVEDRCNRTTNADNAADAATAAPARCRSRRRCSTTSPRASGPAGCSCSCCAPDGSRRLPRRRRRAVLPALRRCRCSSTAEPATERLARQGRRALDGGRRSSVWDALPGVVARGVPVRREAAARRRARARRQEQTRSASAKTSSASAARLGLDGIWLDQQADELPAYGDEAIQRQARLLLGMIRDQVRLAGLEQELDSLSGQLANTYEELQPDLPDQQRHEGQPPRRRLLQAGVPRRAWK